MADYFQQSEDPTAPVKPITHFLKVVWKNLYTARCDAPPDQTLFAQYDTYLRLSERMEKALAATTGPPTQRLALIQWLADNWQLAGPAGPSAITHGDLHADNLFVDMDGRSWAIDFERTTYGPILRDFAELEADIVTRLTRLDPAEPAFTEFIQQLLRPDTFILSVGDQADAPAHRSLLAIACIRQLAAELTGADPHQYWWALLYHAIFVLLIKPNNSVAAERYAAALVAKLEAIYQAKGS